jgi:hypothetical protein
VPSPAVPWQRLLTLVIHQLHTLRSSPHSLLYRNDYQLTTQLLLTSRKGHEGTTRFHCGSQTVALLRLRSLATGKCLSSRCPETVAVCRVIA